MGAGAGSLGARGGTDDVRVTWVDDTEAAHPVVLAAGSAKINIVSVEMVHANFGQHGVVLNLRLPKWRAVVCDDDQLSLGVAQRLEDGLVAQGVLAALHHQLQLVVDALCALLRLLRGSHRIEQPLAAMGWGGGARCCCAQATAGCGGANSIRLLAKPASLQLQSLLSKSPRLN